MGALVDHRYKKAGGKPSSKRDRTLFLLALLLVAGFFILLAFIPIGDDLHDPFRLERIEGQVALPLAVWLFFASGDERQRVGVRAVENAAQVPASCGERSE